MLINHIISLIAPLLVTNVLHMFVVKYNYFSFANYPINNTLFGANKTYRGLLFIIIINTINYYILHTLFFNVVDDIETLVIGGLLGLSYSLAELPNSYLKRKLNIAPGKSAEKNKLFFKLLDKSDSAFLSSVTYSLIFSLNITEWLILFAASVSTHMIISWLLFIFKIKRSF